MVQRFMSQVSKLQLNAALAVFTSLQSSVQYLQYSPSMASHAASNISQWPQLIYSEKNHHYDRDTVLALVLDLTRKTQKLFQMKQI